LSPAGTGSILRTVCRDERRDQSVANKKKGKKKPASNAKSGKK